MNQFATVNEVYNSYFDGDYPARETVQVGALPKFVNVEISMIAIK
jgi:2-iminobutanoate/2-iminopropanoate deaminase